MDDVSRYLQQQGLQPKASYFLDSDYLLGYSIKTEHFNLTYRQEGSRLIICDFTASQMNGKALQSLLTFVKRIGTVVHSVQSIDALIFDEHNNPMLAQQRRRLAEVMRAEGAQPVEVDGDLWLRYPCRPA